MKPLSASINEKTRLNILSLKGKKQSQLFGVTSLLALAACGGGTGGGGGGDINIPPDPDPFAFTATVANVALADVVDGTHDITIASEGGTAGSTYEATIQQASGGAATELSFGGTTGAFALSGIAYAGIYEIVITGTNGSETAKDTLTLTIDGEVAVDLSASGENAFTIDPGDPIPLNSLFRDDTEIDASKISLSGLTGFEFNATTGLIEASGADTAQGTAAVAVEVVYTLDDGTTITANIKTVLNGGEVMLAENQAGSTAVLSSADSGTIEFSDFFADVDLGYTGSDKQTLTFALVDAGGLTDVTLDASTGALSFSSAIGIGDYTIEISADDGFGAITLTHTISSTEEILPGVAPEANGQARVLTDEDNPALIPLNALFLNVGVVDANRASISVPAGSNISFNATSQMLETSAAQGTDPVTVLVAYTFDDSTTLTATIETELNHGAVELISNPLLVTSVSDSGTPDSINFSTFFTDVDVADANDDVAAAKQQSLTFALVNNAGLTNIAIDASSGILTFTGAIASGDYAIQISADDGFGAVTLTHTISSNTPPSVAPGADGQAKVITLETNPALISLDSLFLNVGTIDASKASISVTGGSNISFNPNNEMLETSTAQGTDPITVKVTYTVGDDDNTILTATIETVLNGGEVVLATGQSNTSSVLSASPGTIDFSSFFTDLDVDNVGNVPIANEQTLAFALVADDSLSISIDADTGILTFDGAVPTGTHTIEISADDGFGPVTLTHTISSALNQPPQLVDPAPGLLNSTYIMQGQNANSNPSPVYLASQLFIDNQGDLFSLSLGSNAPAGVVISSDGLTITIDDDDITFGVHVFDIIATDAQGAATTQPFTLTVNEYGLPPVLSVPSEGAQVVGTNLYLGDAESPDDNIAGITFGIQHQDVGEALSYAVQINGLTTTAFGVDASTPGSLIVAPTSGSDFSALAGKKLGVVVTDSIDGNIVTVTLDIIDTPAGNAPTAKAGFVFLDHTYIKQGTNANANPIPTYEASALFTGTDGDLFELSLGASAPAGIALSTDRDSITVDSADIDPGVYTFDIIATELTAVGKSTTLEVTLTVNDFGAAPIITAPSSGVQVVGTDIYAGTATSSADGTIAGITFDITHTDTNEALSYAVQINGGAAPAFTVDQSTPGKLIVAPTSGSDFSALAGKTLGIVATQSIDGGTPITATLSIVDNESVGLITSPTPLTTGETKVGDYTVSQAGLEALAESLGAGTNIFTDDSMNLDALTYTLSKAGTALADGAIVPLNRIAEEYVLVASDGFSAVSHTITDHTVFGTPVAPDLNTPSSYSFLASQTGVDVDNFFTAPDGGETYTYTYSIKLQDGTTIANENIASHFSVDSDGILKTTGDLTNVWQLGDVSHIAIISITAMDSDQETPAVFEMTISNANQAPELASGIQSVNPIVVDRLAAASHKVNIAGNFSDPEGDTLTYAVYQDGDGDGQFDASNDTLVSGITDFSQVSFAAPSDAGSLHFFAQAADSNQSSPVVTYSVYFNDAPNFLGNANQPLQQFVGTPANVSGTDTTEYILNVGSLFDDDETLSYVLSLDAVPTDGQFDAVNATAFVVDSNGMATIDVAYSGSNYIQVVATDVLNDASGQLSTTQILTVDFNRQILINDNYVDPDGDTTAITSGVVFLGSNPQPAGSTFTIDVDSIFTDPDLDNIQYTVLYDLDGNGMKNGLETEKTLVSTDASSLVEFVVIAAEATKFVITARDLSTADNSARGSVASVTLDVNFNSGPTLKPGQLTDFGIVSYNESTVSPSHVVNLDSLFVDPDGDTISYTAWVGSPSNALSISSSTLVDIDITAPGSFVFTVEAEDATGLSNNQTMTIDFNAIPELVADFANSTAEHDDATTSSTTLRNSAVLSDAALKLTFALDNLIVDYDDDNSLKYLVLVDSDDNNPEVSMTIDESGGSSAIVNVGSRIGLVTVTVEANDERVATIPKFEFVQRVYNSTLEEINVDPSQVGVTIDADRILDALGAGSGDAITFQSIKFFENNSEVLKPSGITVNYNPGDTIVSGVISVLSGSWTGLSSNASVQIVVSDGIDNFTLTNAIDFNNIPAYVETLPNPINETFLAIGLDGRLVYHHNDTNLDLSTIFTDSDGDTIVFTKADTNSNYQIVGTDLDFTSTGYSGDVSLNLSDGIVDTAFTISAVFNSGPYLASGQLPNYSHNVSDATVETIDFDTRYKAFIDGATLDFAISYTNNLNDTVIVDLDSDSSNDGIYFDTATNEFRGELNSGSYSGNTAVFNVTVTDSFNFARLDDIRITYSSVFYKAPTGNVTIIPDDNANEVKFYVLPDGNNNTSYSFADYFNTGSATIVYSLGSVVPGISIDSSTGVLTLSNDFLSLPEGADRSVAVTATNSSIATDVATFTAEFVRNAAPVLHEANFLADDSVTSTTIAGVEYFDFSLSSQAGSFSSSLNSIFSDGTSGSPTFTSGDLPTGDYLLVTASDATVRIERQNTNPSTPPFVITVDDGHGGVSMFNARIALSGDAPEFVTVSGKDPYGFINGGTQSPTWTISEFVVDPDAVPGGSLTFSDVSIYENTVEKSELLADDITINSATGVITFTNAEFTYAAQGMKDYIVEVTVNDEFGNEAILDDFSIYVNPQPVLSPAAPGTLTLTIDPADPTAEVNLVTNFFNLIEGAGFSKSNLVISSTAFGSDSVTIDAGTDIVKYTPAGNGNFYFFPRNLILTATVADADRDIPTGMFENFTGEANPSANTLIYSFDIAVESPTESAPITLDPFSDRLINFKNSDDVVSRSLVDSDFAEIDLADHFYDPNGDPITYTGVANLLGNNSPLPLSSVGLQIVGESLKLRDSFDSNLAAGTYSVTIFADDSDQPASSAGFEFVINDVPEINNLQINVAITDTSTTVDLSDLTTNALGSIVYTTSLSGYSVSGSDLMLKSSGRVSGTEAVTITATDSAVVDSTIVTTEVEFRVDIRYIDAPTTMLNPGSHYAHDNDSFVSISPDTFFVSDDHTVSISDSITTTISEDLLFTSLTLVDANGDLADVELSSSQQVVTVKSGSVIVGASADADITFSLDALGELHIRSSRDNPEPYSFNIVATVEDQYGLEATSTFAGGLILNQVHGPKSNTFSKNVIDSLVGAGNNYGDLGINSANPTNLTYSKVTVYSSELEGVGQTGVVLTLSGVDTFTSTDSAVMISLDDKGNTDIHDDVLMFTVDYDIDATTVSISLEADLSDSNDYVLSGNSTVTFDEITLREDDIGSVVFTSVDLWGNGGSIGIVTFADLEGNSVTLDADNDNDLRESFHVVGAKVSATLADDGFLTISYGEGLLPDLTPTGYFAEFHFSNYRASLPQEAITSVGAVTKNFTYYDPWNYGAHTDLASGSLRAAELIGSNTNTSIRQVLIEEAGTGVTTTLFGEFLFNGLVSSLDTVEHQVLPGTDITATITDFDFIGGGGERGNLWFYGAGNFTGPVTYSLSFDFWDNPGNGTDIVEANLGGKDTLVVTLEAPDDFDTGSKNLWGEVDANSTFNLSFTDDDDSSSNFNLDILGTDLKSFGASHLVVTPRDADGNLGTAVSVSISDIGDGNATTTHSIDADLTITVDQSAGSTIIDYTYADSTDWVFPEYELSLVVTNNANTIQNATDGVDTLVGDIVTESLSPDNNPLFGLNETFTLSSTYSLNNYFEDPDGGALTYELISVRYGGVVVVGNEGFSLAGDVLTIPAFVGGLESYGTRELTIRVTDNEGGSREEILSVDVTREGASLVEGSFIGSSNGGHLAFEFAPIYTAAPSEVVSSEIIFRKDLSQGYDSTGEWQGAGTDPFLAYANSHTLAVEDSFIQNPDGSSAELKGSAISIRYSFADNDHHLDGDLFRPGSELDLTFLHVTNINGTITTETIVTSAEYEFGSHLNTIVAELDKLSDGDADGGVFIANSAYDVTYSDSGFVRQNLEVDSNGLIQQDGGSFEHLVVRARFDELAVYTDGDASKAKVVGAVNQADRLFTDLDIHVLTNSADTQRLNIDLGSILDIASPQSYSYYFYSSDAITNFYIAAEAFEADLRINDNRSAEFVFDLDSADYVGLRDEGVAVLDERYIFGNSDAPQYDGGLIAAGVQVDPLARAHVTVQVADADENFEVSSLATLRSGAIPFGLDELTAGGRLDSVGVNTEFEVADYAFAAAASDAGATLDRLITHGQDRLTLDPFAADSDSLFTFHVENLTFDEFGAGLVDNLSDGVLTMEYLAKEQLASATNTAIHATNSVIVQQNQLLFESVAVLTYDFYGNDVDDIYQTITYASDHDFVASLDVHAHDSTITAGSDGSYTYTLFEDSIVSGADSLAANLYLDGKGYALDVVQTAASAVDLKFEYTDSSYAAAFDTKTTDLAYYSLVLKSDVAVGFASTAAEISITYDVGLTDDNGQSIEYVFGTAIQADFDNAAFDVQFANEFVRTATIDTVSLTEVASGGTTVELFDVVVFNDGASENQIMRGFLAENADSEDWNISVHRYGTNSKVTVADIFDINSAGELVLLSDFDSSALSSNDILEVVISPIDGNNVTETVYFEVNKIDQFFSSNSQTNTTWKVGAFVENLDFTPLFNYATNVDFSIELDAAGIEVRDSTGVAEIRGRFEEAGVYFATIVADSSGFLTTETVTIEVLDQPEIRSGNPSVIESHGQEFVTIDFANFFVQPVGGSSYAYSLDVSAGTGHQGGAIEWLNDYNIDSQAGKIVLTFDGSDGNDALIALRVTAFDIDGGNSSVTFVVDETTAASLNAAPGFRSDLVTDGSVDEYKFDGEKLIVYSDVFAANDISGVTNDVNDYRYFVTDTDSLNLLFDVYGGSPIVSSDLTGVDFHQAVYSTLAGISQVQRTSAPDLYNPLVSENYDVQVLARDGVNAEIIQIESNQFLRNDDMEFTGIVDLDVQSQFNLTFGDTGTALFDLSEHYQHVNSSDAGLQDFQLTFTPTFLLNGQQVEGVDFEDLGLTLDTVDGNVSAKLSTKNAQAFTVTLFDDLVTTLVDHGNNDPTDDIHVAISNDDAGSLLTRWTPEYSFTYTDASNEEVILYGIQIDEHREGLQSQNKPQSDAYVILFSLDDNDTADDTSDDLLVAVNVTEDTNSTTATGTVGQHVNVLRPMDDWTTHASTPFDLNFFGNNIGDGTLAEILVEGDDLYLWTKVDPVFRSASVSTVVNQNSEALVLQASDYLPTEVLSIDSFVINAELVVDGAGSVDLGTSANFSVSLAEIIQTTLSPEQLVTGELTHFSESSLDSNPHLAGGLIIDNELKGDDKFAFEDGYLSNSLYHTTANEDFYSVISAVADMNGDGFAEFVMVRQLAYEGEWHQVFTLIDGEDMWNTFGSGSALKWHGEDGVHAAVANNTVSSSVWKVQRDEDFTKYANTGLSGIGRLGFEDLGDINGDGYGDLGVTDAHLGFSSANSEFVIFGGSDANLYDGDGTTQLANGTDAFRIKIEETGSSNSEVQALGDINGDGYADLLITENAGASLVRGDATHATTSSQFDAIQTRIVLGGADWGTTMNAGTDGNNEDLNIAALDAAGRTLKIRALATEAGTDANAAHADLRKFQTIGDFDGDGVVDFMYLANTEHATNDAELYAISGADLFANLTAGTISIEDIAHTTFSFTDGAGDTTGIVYAGIEHGDLNNDGIDDLFILASDRNADASNAWSAGNSRAHVNEAFVIYGDADALANTYTLTDNSTSRTAGVDLLTINDGADSSNATDVAESGMSERGLENVADILDLNADGINDLVVHYERSWHTNIPAGAVDEYHTRLHYTDSYVFHGVQDDGVGDQNIDVLNRTGSYDRLIEVDNATKVFENRDVNADGLQDVVIQGSGIIYDAFNDIDINQTATSEEGNGGRTAYTLPTNASVSVLLGNELSTRGSGTFDEATSTYIGAVGDDTIVGSSASETFVVSSARNFSDVATLDLVTQFFRYEGDGTKTVLEVTEHVVDANGDIAGTSLVDANHRDIALSDTSGVSAARNALTNYAITDDLDALPVGTVVIGGNSTDLPLNLGDQEDVFLNATGNNPYEIVMAVVDSSGNLVELAGSMVDGELVGSTSAIWSQNIESFLDQQYAYDGNGKPEFTAPAFLQAIALSGHNLKPSGSDSLSDTQFYAGLFNDADNGLSNATSSTAAVDLVLKNNYSLVVGYRSFEYDLPLINEHDGNDRIIAGAGDDVVYVRNTEDYNLDYVDGGAGSDTVVFSSLQTELIDLTNVTSQGKIRNVETLQISSAADTLHAVDSDYNVQVGGQGNGLVIDAQSAIDIVNGGLGQSGSVYNLTIEGNFNDALFILNEAGWERYFSVLNESGYNVLSNINLDHDNDATTDSVSVFLHVADSVHIDAGDVIIQAAASEVFTISDFRDFALDLDQVINPTNDDLSLVIFAGDDDIINLSHTTDELGSEHIGARLSNFNTIDISGGAANNTAFIDFDGARAFGSAGDTDHTITFVGSVKLGELDDLYIGGSGWSLSGNSNYAIYTKVETVDSTAVTVSIFAPTGLDVDLSGINHVINSDDTLKFDNAYDALAYSQISTAISEIGGNSITSTATLSISDADGVIHADVLYGILQANVLIDVGLGAVVRFDSAGDTFSDAGTYRTMTKNGDVLTIADGVVIDRAGQLFGSDADDMFLDVDFDELAALNAINGGGLDGGAGNDEVHLNFAGSLNLKNESSKLENIEILNIANGNSNILTFGYQVATQIAGGVAGESTLTLVADATDFVTLDTDSAYWSTFETNANGDLNVTASDGFVLVISGTDFIEVNVSSSVPSSSITVNSSAALDAIGNLTISDASNTAYFKDTELVHIDQLRKLLIAGTDGVETLDFTDAAATAIYFGTRGDAADNTFGLDFLGDLTGLTVILGEEDSIFLGADPANNPAGNWHDTGTFYAYYNPLPYTLNISVSDSDGNLTRATNTKGVFIGGYTGSTGSDVLAVESISDLDSIDGGAGIDTLFFAGDGNYSLSGLTAGQIKHVENINLRNGVDNTLTFSDTWFDLHDAATPSTKAVIYLDDNDVVEAPGSWLYVPIANGFNTYEKVIGGTTHTLEISENAAPLSLIATTVSGVIEIKSDVSSFVTINGAGSNGTLSIDDPANASEFDLADLYYIDRISGINVIDFGDGGTDSDFIRVDAVVAANVLGTGATALTIRGASYDLVEFVGTWKEVASGNASFVRMQSEIYAGSGDYISVDYSAAMATKSVTDTGTVFNGTSGNNTFVVQSVAGVEVRGGAGIDTLLLGEQAGLRIDLADTTSVNSFANRVSDIEIIDLSVNVDGSTVRLDALGVAAVTDSNNSLDVVMDGNDQVLLQAGGTSSTYSGLVFDNVALTTHHVFTITDGSDEAVVRFVASLVNEDVSWIGTTGADTLTIADWEDLTDLGGYIDGGAGTDEIVLEGDPAKAGAVSTPDFDLTSAGSVSFAGIETITMQHTENQTLKLDFASVSEMLNGSGTLTVNLNDGDTVFVGDLTSGWTKSGSGDTQTYTYNTNTSVIIDFTDDAGGGNATISNYDI